MTSGQCFVFCKIIYAAASITDSRTSGNECHLNAKISDTLLRENKPYLKKTVRIVIVPATGLTPAISNGPKVLHLKSLLQGANSSLK